MAKLLFRLNGVSDDEANEVRALLAEHEFDVYETDAGRWRISVAAIWLRNNADYDKARALLDEYQHERGIRIRAEAQNLPTFWQQARDNPVDTIMVLLGVAALTALMLWPFFYNW